MPIDKRAIHGVTDSKALRPAERERLATRIRADATARALARATPRLGLTPDQVLIDGKPIRSLAVPHKAVIGGDSICYSIACASIVAKVVRDRLMSRLAVRYPGYSWETNSGYGTPAHLSALRVAGMTPHHRVAFCRTALGGQLEIDDLTVDAGLM